MGFTSLKEGRCLRSNLRVRASAKPASFHKPKELEKAIAKIEEEMAQSLLGDAELKAGLEDSPEILEGPLPKELDDKKKRKEKLQKALDYSNSIEGKRPGTTSTTDHDSRMMKRGKTSKPAYNCQASVDMESGCVVGGYASNDGLDWNQLSPGLDSIEEHAGGLPQKLAGDRGYYTGDNIRLLGEAGIEGYIPVIERGPEGFQQKDFTYNPEDDEFICPAGRLLIPLRNRAGKFRKDYRSLDCSGCENAQLCIGKTNKSEKRSLAVMLPKRLFEEHRVRWKSDRGKEMSKKRMTTVEPTFGQIKYGRGLRQFFVRGLDMVDAMWKMELCAHNLVKLGKAMAQ